MKIPEEKIQEIREATDIIEVVSQYVTLKKRGKSYIGLCPFHTEKTPSFSVDPVRGFYHCFGCGVGGNVFTFVMQMERVAFPEAIRSLAEKAGIPLPKYEVDDTKIKEIERLYHANQFALDFFQQCLFQSENGKKVLAYLQKRDLKQEIVKRFQIGYAPSSWDGLLNRARKASLKDDVLHKAGLIVSRKDQTGYYDRFRERLMFPILNVSGRVVGFGGRILKKTEDAPKYINTPETPIYQKSRLLYGLFQSKAGIQREDRVLLVEGYTDLMQLHQHGFDYVVATSGTALTEEQAGFIQRYTKNVTLLFDGDSAGFAAAMRGVDILLDNGLKVDIVALPKGFDPDSFLRKRGSEPLSQLLTSKRTFIDFQIDRMKDQDKLNTPNDRVIAARQLLNVLQKIRDPLERNVMIKDLAEKLHIEERLLWNEFKKYKEPLHEKEQPADQKGTYHLESAEQDILKLLLENQKKWLTLIFRYTNSNDFQSDEAHVLFRAFHQEYLKKGTVESKIIMDRFADNAAVIQYLTQLLSNPIGEGVDRGQLGLDCLMNLRQNYIQNQIQKVREEMKRAENSGDEVTQLSQQYIALKQKFDQFKHEISDAWKKNVEI